MAYLRIEERSEGTIEKYRRDVRKLFRRQERELTRAEYERLVQTAERKGTERLALLLETIAATGIRVSEVKYLTVEASKVGRAATSLKGKIRVILLPNKLCRKLLKYDKNRFRGDLSHKKREKSVQTADLE